MIVADTSALVSIASIDLLDTFLAEFDVQTTETVTEELEETSEYDDRHGEAADDVLERSEALKKLDELAEQRNWLGAPIYRRAESLFE